MQYLAICEDDLLFQFMRNVAAEQVDVRYLVPSETMARRIRRQGGKVRHGDLTKEETYKKLKLRHVDQAIVFVRDAGDQSAVCRLLRALDKNISIVSLTSEKNGKKEAKGTDDPLVRHLQLADIFAEFCAAQLLDTLNIKKVERIRSLFGEGEKIHILLQHDPDPDAIGSALALRELLGRNRADHTDRYLRQREPAGKFRDDSICWISKSTELRRSDLHKDGARLALVDVQPPYFEQPLGRVDLVVDHHPKRTNFKAHFTDLRSGYGSTATIFTEYLRAVAMEPSQRLATALLYGIKTDTLFLERGSNLADLSAFNFLYPIANKAMIARIERPALPREDLEAMGRALSRLQVDSGVAVIHLGEVNREDVIPQMAEFCLQIEGADWSVVSGLVKDRVVICVRNVGYVKSAGDIMKKLYDDIGSAGGHRAMAKAVVPLDRFKERYGEVSEKVIRDAMLPMIVDRDQIELELR